MKQTCWTALIMMLIAAPLRAQELVYGPEIEIESPDELGFANAIRLAWVGADHLYWIDRVAGVVLQHDKQGRFIQQIGSPGEGPGEYLQPTTVVEDGADVLVFGFGRAHRFHIDGSYDRSWNVPWIARDAVPLEEGKLLINVTSTADPDMAALALHVVDLEGATYQSFDEFTLYSRMSGHGDRILGQDGERVIAVPKMYRAALTTYDTYSGAPSTRELSLSWFWPYDKVVFSHPEKRPTPTMMGAWTADDLVYVFGRSPDRRWKRAGGTDTAVGGGETVYAVSRETRHLLNDFHLEILDAATGESIAGFAFDSHEESGLMQKGYRISWTDDEFGFWHVSIRSVRFQPHEGRSP